MTVIAVTEVPPILCPAWCTVTRKQHIDDLEALEGRVIHWGAERGGEQGCSIQLATTTYVDGTPDPTDETHLFIVDAGFQDGATLEQAESYARLLLEIVQEYRR